jgi:gamma-D-glutamyl-L-lysine dipeptidyl-peptidase
MGSIVARSAVVPMQREPSLRAEQVSQLVLGETGRVEETQGLWRRIATDYDGYGGWVHAGYLLEVGDEAAARWREQARGWSLGATLATDGVSLPLPLRARVGLADGGVVLPDGRRARVVEGAVPPEDEVVAHARAMTPRHWALEHFAGAPYAWGGVTPWGVDCSGLVQTAFAARGLVVPRDSAVQAEMGATVPMDAICPGDLLFFRGEAGPAITHVAFAGESETLIHSTVACGGVIQEPWTPGTRAGVLRAQLAVVRRVDG